MSTCNPNAHVDDTRFPFQRGDRIQHVSGTGPVFIVRGADNDAWEAWAEREDGFAGGTRVLNPTNWQRVATDPRDRATPGKEKT